VKLDLDVSLPAPVFNPALSIKVFGQCKCMEIQITGMDLVSAHSSEEDHVICLHMLNQINTSILIFIFSGRVKGVE